MGFFHFHFLRKYFLKKVVPGTSNHWPYHSDLLVSCLKFRFSSFCEYLNYYYNIANDYWAIPEKTQTGEFEDILFEKKNPEVFRFVTLRLAILHEKMHYP